MKVFALLSLAALIFFSGGLIRADDDTPLPSDDPRVAKLYQACVKGDLETVKDLLDSGAPIDGQVGELRCTPLIIATCKGNTDVVNFLVAHHASVNLPDNQGSTPLLHSCWEDKPAAALALINGGADVNKGSAWGRTPLMYAAMHGDDQIVQALLAHKVTLDAACDQGPAISWAASSDHFSTVKLLGDAGAHPDASAGSTEGYTPLADAAVSDDLPMIDYLIGIKADVNLAGGNKLTPLMAAVNNDNVEAVAHLLAHGARTDVPAPTGLTPLMQSSLHRDANMIRELLQAKADLNATDSHGETALTLAGDRGEVDVVQLLKDAGAKRTDPHIIARESTGPNLSRRQAWALAVAAIFVQEEGDNPHDLGFDREEKWSKGTLQQARNVTDKAGLLKVLDDLRDHGDRARFREQGERLDRMNDTDFNNLVAGQPGAAAKLAAARGSYRKWKDRTGLAYDLCREANFINYGFAAGYLNANESWARLMEIARSAQTSFSSWQELGDNFLDARAISMGRDPQFEACTKLLLNPQDPNSPWNQCPWKTEFPAANPTPPASVDAVR